MGTLCLALKFSTSQVSQVRITAILVAPGIGSEIRIGVLYWFRASGRRSPVIYRMEDQPPQNTHLSPFATGNPSSACVPSTEVQSTHQQHQSQESFSMIRSKLWTDFQTTATALSKMYRDGHHQGLESSQQQRDFWASFQFSAAALTQLYKTAIESVEVMQHQQNQRVAAAAAAATSPPPPTPPPPPSSPPSPPQCSNCNQKLNWCQSCNPNAPFGRMTTFASLATSAPMPPPPTDCFVGKKSPPGSPMAATAAMEQQTTNRLKRTREAMAAAEGLFGFGEPHLFIKRFRKNHDPDDLG